MNRDDDTVLDGLDNCPAVANADQSDRDANGVGEACDAPIGDCGLDGSVSAATNWSSA